MHWSLLTVDIETKYNAQSKIFMNLQLSPVADYFFSLRLRNIMVVSFQ